MTFNLDSIVGKCVHRPIASNDPNRLPLYKRNDGAFDESKTLNQTRSEAWMKAVENHYSSPNNVRRVFITHNGVYVHYFKPQVGDSRKELEKYYEYSSINDKFNPAELFARRDTMSITKLGMGALRGRWTCSNIEEIYFDWTVLLSSELHRLGLSNLMGSMTAPGTTQIMPGDILWTLFNSACLNNGEKVSSVFPRLKYIGYISELQIVYKASPKSTNQYSNNELIRPWWKSQAFMSASKDKRFYVALYKVPNVSSINMKYATRSFYNFDEEVLKPHFDTMCSRMAKMIADSRVSSTSGEASNSEKKPENDFRTLLASVEKEKGLETAKKICNMMLNLPSSNKQEMLNSLTEEERKKYYGGV